MQADLFEIKLFILLSFAHGAIDLLERFTVVIRDYVWYFIYKKLKRDEGNQFESKSISLAKEHALCGRDEHSDDPGRINVVDSSGRFLSDLQVYIQRSKGVVRDNRIFHPRLHCY